MISPLPLGEMTSNIGTLFLNNQARYGESHAFAERDRAIKPTQALDGAYRYWSWNEMVGDIIKAAGFYASRGLIAGDRCAFISANSYARLTTEMAAMSSGIVSVPIFQGYPSSLISELLGFSKVKALVVEHLGLLEDIAVQTLPKIIVVLKQSSDPLPAVFKDRIFFFDDFLDSAATAARHAAQTTAAQFCNVTPSSLAMIMFTSGTSGRPKGVQLTHQNIMSQQKALQLLWKPEPHMRFLCYLPWHHSFGGLFERFFVLHSGGCLAIDDSCGKNIDQLLKNFSEIRPNVYFSVPKVYQEIVSKVLISKKAEKEFFNPELKFIFTAAAPLPLSTSKVFKAKGVPVVEGWGLTETSPCCTLTEMSLDRKPGVVGFPIPGVEVKLSDENEILVRGPNVMRGYLDLPEVTALVLDNQGWFKTGDLGEITPSGLRILSRKDRMFKLSNGEKVFPSELEERVKSRCRFVKHAYVFGGGEPHPCLIVFPNFELLAAGSACHGSDEECVYPECVQAFSRCLGQCIQEINNATLTRVEQIHKALIVQRELKIENNELTPSFKLIPGTIQERYHDYISDALPVEIIKLREMQFDETNKFHDMQLKKIEHYGIIGMGPIGSILAVFLKQAGCKVSVFDANPTKQALMKDHPLTVSGTLNASARLTDVYPDLVDFIAARPQVILIATKSCDSAELLKKISQCNPSKETVFVACQNGLDVENRIGEVFGTGRALRMILNIGCKFSESGRSAEQPQSQSKNGNDVHVAFFYTNYLSQRKEVNPDVILQIANHLNSSGFRIEMREDYQTEAFKKAILNSSLSTVCALTGWTMKAAISDPEFNRVVKEMVREGIAVACAMGLNIRQDFLEQAMAYMSGGADHKPSMLLDLECKRKTENEDLCGRIYYYAEKHGVSVPVTQTIYYLMKNLERRADEN